MLHVQQPCSSVMKCHMLNIYIYMCIRCQTAVSPLGTPLLSCQHTSTSISMILVVSVPAICWMNACFHNLTSYSGSAVVACTCTAEPQQTPASLKAFHIAVYECKLCHYQMVLQATQAVTLMVPSMRILCQAHAWSHVGVLTTVDLNILRRNHSPP